MGDFDATVAGTAVGSTSFGLRYAGFTRWSFDVVIGGGSVWAAEFASGSPRLVAQVATTSTAGTLRVVRQGTQVTGWLDGTQLFSANDDGIARHGELGLTYLQGTLVTFDDGGLQIDGNPSDGGANFTLFRVDSVGAAFVDDGGAPPNGGDAGLPLFGSYCSAAPSGGACTDAIEFWLGRPVLFGQDFEAGDSWTNIEGPGWQFPPWQSWKEEEPNRRFVLAVPLFPGAPSPDGGTPSLEECASGAYDAHWATLATHLVAADLADTWLRPGWEFNGDWQPWTAMNDPVAFSGCFRSLVTAMRAVSGAEFQFIWNPSIGYTALTDPTTAYPGDDVVDVIGIDAYDVDYGVYPTSGPVTSAQQASAWTDISTGHQGLAYYSTLAAQHRKPLGIPEWGVWGIPHAGYDNPLYIQGMYDFMADPANNVTYQSYFDVYAGDGDHELMRDTQFPFSAATYHRLFGQ